MSKVTSSLNSVKYLNKNIPIIPPVNLELLSIINNKRVNTYMPHIMQNAFPILPLLILTETLWVGYDQSHFTDEKAAKIGLEKVSSLPKRSNS